MRCINAVTALALFACMLSAADQHAPPNHQRQAPPKTSVARLPDAQLEAAIRAKFTKSKINADKFQVRVQGGVATIEGRTDVIQHKGVATRMAKTAGAAAVNNRIQISDAARQKAAGNLEKGRRRVQVQRSEPRSDAAPPRRR
jgi:hypothetical protein